MMSKRWLGLAGVAVLGTSAAAVVGCGGSKATTGAGGATSSTSTSKATTGVTTSKASVTSSSTGMTGNHTCANATPIMLGAAATPATLVDTMTPDCYSFTGKAGDRIFLSATAQGLITTAGHNPNDPTVTDTVVSLLLPDMMTVWASDDDGHPRTSTDSALYTQLPMDGTYYVKVEDCNSYAPGHTGIACAPAANVMTFDYQIFGANLTTTAGAEFLGKTGTPTTLTYTANPMSAGNFYSDTIDGNFAAAGDVQTFNFTPPSTIKVDPTARTRAYFWVQPIGAVDGDGSAVDAVVTAKDMSGNILAMTDQQFYNNGDDPTNGPLQLSFPIDDQFGNKLGSAFTLSVALSGKTPLATTKNFYFVQHFAGPFDYGQPEAEGPLGTAMNDTAATAETLKVPTGVTGAAFVDGNLSSAADVDWYKMTVPSGLTKNVVYLGCTAARDGSGLRGFTAQLFKDATGTASLTTIGPEGANPTKDLDNGTMGTMVPAGTTTVTLKVSATSQDATVKGSYYHCTLNFQ